MAKNIQEPSPRGALHDLFVVADASTAVSDYVVGFGQSLGILTYRGPVSARPPRRSPFPALAQAIRRPGSCFSHLRGAYPILAELVPLA